MHIQHLAVWRERGSKQLQFRLVIDKGSFVSSLAHDFGAQLGTAAHLAALRREQIGDFRVADAWPMQVLLPMARKYGRSLKGQ